MESSRSLLAIDGMMGVAAVWLAIGFAGIAWLRDLRVVARVLFPLSAALSLVLAALALVALPGAPQTAVLAIGLPGDSCRHGDVTAEQVVAAAHRSAHVDSDPNSNIVVPLALYVSV